MQIKKVLFLTGKLQHYRIPIFNLIVKNYNINLTVAHSGEKMNDGSFLFIELILKERKIGPIIIHDNSLFNLCNSYDVVVAMFYLQRISFMKLVFIKDRKFKIIYWGIGVKASQKSKFDQPTILNYFRYYIANKSDAMIFYSNYAKEKYISKGVINNKLFVMNNTVSISSVIKNQIQKHNIIFVGTLNKSKKIFRLLSNYRNTCEKYKNYPMLEIVGNGKEFVKVQKWISKNSIDEKIILHGSVFNEIELEIIFNRALVCISPGQAGLSVLKSFGYGVPFITSNDAITGGERLNIENGINGVLLNSRYDLKKVLVDIYFNPEKYIKMGNNAKKFYYDHRTPEQMAQGFIDAINYVFN